MEKYIKQEVPDMQKTGEQKVFYRMKVERNIDFQEFIHIPQLPMRVCKINCVTQYFSV